VIEEISDEESSSDEDDGFKFKESSDVDDAVYQDVDYISQLKIGCQTTKNEQETFETDLYQMDVKICSIVLSLSDGEIENFIGRFKTSTNPQVELVFKDF
jgi:hypothetical protein